MLINLRDALIAGKRMPTAKDYVQNGLVAMWDGIENAGWGVHDASASNWTELVSGLTTAKKTNNIWTEKSLFIRAATYRSYFTLVKTTPTMSRFTIEVSYRWEKNTSNEWGRIICFRNSLSWNYPGIEIYNEKGAVQTGLFAGLVWGPDTSTYEQWGTGTLDYKKNNTASIKCTGSRTFAIANGGEITWDTSCYLKMNSTAQWRVGSNTDGSCSEDSYVNSIRVYSRDLTADEIAHNYAIDKARFGLT